MGVAADTLRGPAEGSLRRRDYEHGSLDGVHPPPPSYSRQGRTPGGGVIYAPDSGRTHVVIIVRDGQGSFEYGLMGGP